MKHDWLENEINFYDFIWKAGTELCGAHVNKELMEDFAAGGDKFEQMKKLILEKFPTRELAIESLKNETTNTQN